jgi:hypothetical protein
MDALNLTFFTESITPSLAWNTNRATFYNDAVIVTSSETTTHISAYNAEDLRIVTDDNGRVSVTFSTKGNYVQFVIVPE